MGEAGQNKFGFGGLGNGGILEFKKDIGISEFHLHIFWNFCTSFVFVNLPVWLNKVKIPKLALNQSHKPTIYFSAGFGQMNQKPAFQGYLLYKNLLEL